MGLAFPTASVAVTSGIGAGERGLAGGLFVTAQQGGQAIGLAVLATIAAARTNADNGSLVSGYKASFLVATGITVAAALIVAIQMRTRTGAKGDSSVKGGDARVRSHKVCVPTRAAQRPPVRRRGTVRAF